MILFSQLPTLLDGQIIQMVHDEDIQYLLTDSRKALSSSKSLFFAIKGVRNDGHDHIASAYDQGVRQFVVEKKIEAKNYPLANIIKVASGVKGLQALATHHRTQFTYPVIGITGSNGKTIVKEWLYQMLSSTFNCVKNPGSYNSQIGVPLSVWQMNNQHELGIFEAGISQPGEMELLQKIIQPSIGIFTNLGSAHDEGFESTRDKLTEKLHLFSKSTTLIYCSDYEQIADIILKSKGPDQEWIGWGQKTGSNVLLKFINDENVHISSKYGDISLRLPFDDFASKENLLHCIVTLLFLGLSETAIQERIDQIHSIPMRLELKQGINQCQIVDDTYNNDLGGIQIGLDFLHGLNAQKKTLILSDVLQSGLTLEELSLQIILLLKENGIQKFVGVGFGFHSQQKLFEDLTLTKKFYLTTEDFINDTDWNQFSNEAILVKGARVFQFERVVQMLQKKIHGTVMEINLDAMVHNLNFFRSLLKPDVKLMVMVKAFAYGSGSNEIANLLQYHRVDYLGVAYVDEGVELRNNHIRVPIMVMNPTETGFSIMLDRDLEPEIYSLGLLSSLAKFLNGRELKIHLKIDTGMHRLGLAGEDISDAIEILKKNQNIKIASIFSHLAGADDGTLDDFTNEQAKKFEVGYEKLCSALDILPLMHLLNSSGILRFTGYQYDMVRLGIGLYGIDPARVLQSQLRPVATLKTVVSQIKKVNKGETIGYGRKWEANEPMVIATIAIGYADGYSRAFGNGNGQVVVRGKKAAVVGNVCMDMTMVDITGIANVQEGDEVIVFGNEMPIQQLAAKIDTIPYEILTNTSERVKRVFHAESM